MSSYDRDEWTCSSCGEHVVVHGAGQHTCPRLAPAPVRPDAAHAKEEGLTLMVCRVLNVIAQDPDLGPAYRRAIGAPEGPHPITATNSPRLDELAHKIEDALGR